MTDHFYIQAHKRNTPLVTLNQAKKGGRVYVRNPRNPMYLRRHYYHVGNFVYALDPCEHRIITVMKYDSKYFKN